MNSENFDLIKNCIKNGRILWTYHVNMRLKDRFIPRHAIISSTDTFEVVEEYPASGGLPGCLILLRYCGQYMHVQLAFDGENEKVVIVTAYRPDPGVWNDDMKTRRRR